MPTTTYTSNGTFHVTGSSLAVTMSCVGAGGHGSSTGNGGSGGAYARSHRTLYTGSYSVYVGQVTTTDGGNSYILSGSNNIVIIRAPGGKKDGTIDHQEALLTGSVYAYYGGHGSPDFLGYSSYNGSVGVGVSDGVGVGVVVGVGVAVGPGVGVSVGVAVGAIEKHGFTSLGSNDNVSAGSIISNSSVVSLPEFVTDITCLEDPLIIPLINPPVLPLTFPSEFLM